MLSKNIIVKHDGIICFERFAFALFDYSFDHALPGIFNPLFWQQFRAFHQFFKLKQGGKLMPADRITFAGT